MNYKTKKKELKLEKVNYEKNVVFEEAIDKLGVIALFYKFIKTCPEFGCNRGTFPNHLWCGT